MVGRVVDTWGPARDVPTLRLSVDVPPAHATSLYPPQVTGLVEDVLYSVYATMTDHQSSDGSGLVTTATNHLTFTT